MSEKKELWRQYLVASVANLNSFLVGAIFAYTAPAGALLLEGNSSLQITEAQNSWFTSSQSIGAVVGSLVAYVFLQKLGRRGTMLISGIPLLAGWILLAAAQNFAMLLLGRLSQGLAVGTLVVAVPPYVGEISDTSIRGRLGSLYMVGITLGNLSIFAPSSLIGDFRWIAASMIPPTVLCIVLTYFFVYESPVYLVDQNRQEEAKVALKKLNGPHSNIEPLIESINTLAEDYGSKTGKMVDLKCLKIKEVYWPFMLIIAIQFFQQFGGLNPILFNMYIIFDRSGVSISSALESSIFCSLGLVASLSSSYLMDKVGRKFLIITSYCGTGASLILLGVFFHLSTLPTWEAWVYSKLWWLPAFSVLGIGFFFAVAGTFIGYVLVAEYFPPNVRMFCSSVVSVATWLFSFLVTQTYVQTRNSLGDGGVYWLYASVCIACVIFTIFFIPETKGKSFIEITTYFKTGRFPNKTSERQ